MLKPAEKEEQYNAQKFDLISALADSNLEELQRSFDAFPNSSVELADFAAIVRAHCALLTKWSDSEIEKLFDNIDCDGDGFLTWDEMYNFALHSATMRLQTRPAEQIRPYSFSKRVKRTDNVLAMHYIGSLDLIAVSSRHSPLQLLNPETLKVEKTLTIKDTSGSGGGSSTTGGGAATTGGASAGYVGPLSICYAPKGDILAAFCTDMRLHAWGFSEHGVSNFSPVAVEYAVTRLRYTPAAPSMFYASDRAGSLLMYDVTRQMLNEPRLRGTVAVHTGQEGSCGISDFCFMVASNNRILTASLDHSLALTDFETQAVTPIGRSPSVITQMEYCDGYQCAAAASVDMQMTTWVTHSAKSPSTLLSDPSRPHLSKIISVQTVMGMPQVISTDASGMIKVWDLRMYRCSQTLIVGTTADSCEGEFLDEPPEAGSAENDVGTRRSVNAAIFVESTKEIVCSDPNGFVCHEYGRGVDPELADQQHTVAIAYNSNANTFVTASAKDLHIWDAQEGVLLTTIKKAAMTDITAMCVDTKGRRVFIGTQEGRVDVRSYHSLVLLKSVPLHDKEVSSVAYCEAKRAIVSSSLDGTLSVHFEGEPTAPITRIMFGKGQLLSLAVSGNLSLIAVGYSTGKVYVTDFTYPRVVMSEVQLEEEEEEGEEGGGGEAEHDKAARAKTAVRAIVFLEPFALFATGHANGEVAIWTCRPALTTTKLVSFFLPNSGHKSYQLNEGKRQFEVDCSLSPLCLSFDSAAHNIIVGDSAGGVSVWCVCGLLQCIRARKVSYPSTPMFEVKPLLKSLLLVAAPVMVHHNPTAHSEELLSIEIVPYFSLFATSGADRRVLFWNLDTFDRAGELSAGRLASDALLGPKVAHGAESRLKTQRKNLKTAALKIGAFNLLQKQRIGADHECRHPLSGNLQKLLDEAPMLARRRSRKLSNVADLVKFKAKLAHQQQQQLQILASGGDFHSISPNSSPLSPVASSSYSSVGGGEQHFKKPVRAKMFVGSLKKQLGTAKKHEQRDVKPSGFGQYVGTREGTGCLIVAGSDGSIVLPARPTKAKGCTARQQPQSMEEKVEEEGEKQEKNEEVSLSVGQTSSTPLTKDRLVAHSEQEQPLSLSSHHIHRVSNTSVSSQLLPQLKGEPRQSDQDDGRKKEGESFSTPNRKATKQEQHEGGSPTIAQCVEGAVTRLRGLEEIKRHYKERMVSTARVGIAHVVEFQQSPTHSRRPMTSTNATSAAAAAAVAIATSDAAESARARPWTSGDDGGREKGVGSRGGLRRGVVPLSRVTPPRPPPKSDARDRRIQLYHNELGRCLRWQTKDLHEKLLDSSTVPRNWSAHVLRHELFYTAATAPQQRESMTIDETQQQQQ